MTVKKGLQLIGCILLCEAAGALGSIFTFSQIDSWYRSELVLPAFTPPNWLFGPVWTILYALMGTALFLLLTSRGGIFAMFSQGYRIEALFAFWAQLFFNAIWTPIFFGAHILSLSVVIIITLLSCIVWTMIAGYHVNKTVTYLFIPYLLWVSFAAILNSSIWWLNR